MLLRLFLNWGMSCSFALNLALLMLFSIEYVVHGVFDLAPDSHRKVKYVMTCCSDGFVAAKSSLLNSLNLF